MTEAEFKNAVRDLKHAKRVYMDSLRAVEAALCELLMAVRK